LQRKIQLKDRLPVHGSRCLGFPDTSQRYRNGGNPKLGLYYLHQLPKLPDISGITIRGWLAGFHKPDFAFAIMLLVTAIETATVGREGVVNVMARRSSSASKKAMHVGRTANPNRHTPDGGHPISAVASRRPDRWRQPASRPETPYVLLDPSFAAMYATAPSSVTSFG
jgi:hypothetical protein